MAPAGHRLQRREMTVDDHDEIARRRVSDTDRPQTADFDPLEALHRHGSVRSLRDRRSSLCALRRVRANPDLGP